MPFRKAAGSPSRRRAAGRGASVAMLPAALVGVLLARSGAAAPLDDPFVGGLGFNGPTADNLGAIYWNPAALSLVRGFQIMVAGSAQLTSVGVTRAAIDPSSGMSLPGQTGASAHGRNFRQPFQWPPGPGAYVALSTDAGGDRFALGFAAYMPFLEQIHFPLSAARDEPTRYQVLSMDLRTLALVPALSIRFGADFRVGLAPQFLFTTGSLSFAEDTALDGGTSGLAEDCGGMPCGAENPAAAARYDISSGQGIGDATFAASLGGGVYYRRRNLELGASYQSRAFGGTLNGVEVTGDQSSATLPPRAGGGPVSCGGGQSTRCVFGDINYRLPDVVIVGVAWHLRPGLELAVMARWIWLHLHDRIDVRLTGPTLEADGLPQHIVLYRGFNDVVDARGRIAYWWRERIRVGGELRIETSAVPTDAVNAAAVDGPKVEPVALIEVRVHRRLWLSAGYGLTIMPAVTVTTSAFHPGAATSCADSGGDLNACSERNGGTARPTAAGTYTSFTQDFGLTLNAKF